MNELLIFSGIKPGDTIELKNRDGLLFFWVRDLQNKLIAIEMDLREKIGLLKAFIEMKEGIPIFKQRLYYNSRYLEDDKDLANCNIQRECEIKMK